MNVLGKFKLSVLSAGEFELKNRESARFVDA